MTDAATAEIMRVCRLLGVTLHVRGSDAAPVIEFREKRTRRIVGGSEIRRRLADRGITINKEILDA